MKGLLLKDLYMTKKYCRSFLLLIVVFTAVSVFGNDSAFMIFYPCMVTGMIPVTLLSYDEREKWNEYAGTLPYDRADLVSVKYIMALLLGAVMVVFSTAAQTAKLLIRGTFTPGELLSLLMTFIVVSLIVPTLMLPFFFRFGVEKGRVAYYVTIGVICGGLAVLSGVGDGTGGLFAGRTLSGFTALVLVAVLFAVSWRLSVCFYQRREI